MRELVSAFKQHDLILPHMHLFDSFEGLPSERPGVEVPPIWEKGAFKAPFEEFEAKLKSLDLAEDEISVYRGWFKDTLVPRLVENGTFRSALYVDVDADLYESTLDALDFLFEHQLVQPGTLIGYDDWGDTDQWTAGESRAHKEIMAKYGAECIQLFSWGEPPLIRKLFLVDRIEDARR